MPAHEDDDRCRTRNGQQNPSLVVELEHRVHSGQGTEDIAQKQELGHGQQENGPRQQHGVQYRARIPWMGCIHRLPETVARPAEQRQKENRHDPSEGPTLRNQRLQDPRVGLQHRGQAVCGRAKRRRQHPGKAQQQGSANPYQRISPIVRTGSVHHPQAQDGAGQQRGPHQEELAGPTWIQKVESHSLHLVATGQQVWHNHHGGSGQHGWDGQPEDTDAATPRIDARCTQNRRRRQQTANGQNIPSVHEKGGGDQDRGQAKPDPFGWSPGQPTEPAKGDRRMGLTAFTGQPLQGQTHRKEQERSRQDMGVIVAEQKAEERKLRDYLQVTSVKPAVGHDPCAVPPPPGPPFRSVPRDFRTVAHIQRTPVQLV